MIDEKKLETMLGDDHREELENNDNFRGGYERGYTKKGHNKKSCGHDCDCHEDECELPVEPCCDYEWICEDTNELPEDVRRPIKKSLGDIVESIAIQENGLANILEAEGKKICKAICVAKCVDDLIKVNKSVRNTIKQVNSVQIVLLDKLQEVTEICDGCECE